MTGFPSVCGSDDCKVISDSRLGFVRDNAIHTNEGLFVDAEAFRGEDVNQQAVARSWAEGVLWVAGQVVHGSSLV